jgi:hypothetical protein
MHLTASNGPSQRASTSGGLDGRGRDKRRIGIARPHAPVCALHAICSRASKTRFHLRNSLMPSLALCLWLCTLIIHSHLPLSVGLQIGTYPIHRREAWWYEELGLFLYIPCGNPTSFKHKSLSCINTIFMWLLFHLYSYISARSLPIGNYLVATLFYTCDSHDCILIFLSEILPYVFL